jgi:Flp pilus assembly pilin Flp
MAAAQAALNLVMNLNPFVLIATLIAGLVAAFVTAYATSETFRNKVNAVFDAVKSKVSSAIATVKSVISGMVSAVQSAVSKIKSAFNFSWSLPKPKLPHFSVSGGEAPWGFMGKGSLPRVSVDWYAKGAIFSEPTLFATPSGMKGVGEAGAEAVAPLSDLLTYVREAVRDEVGGQRGGYVANINVTTGETSEAKLAKLIAREEKRQAYALGAI